VPEIEEPVKDFSKSGFAELDNLLQQPKTTAKKQNLQFNNGNLANHE
jgi:hypothetical protein